MLRESGLLFGPPCVYDDDDDAFGNFDTLKKDCLSDTVDIRQIQVVLSRITCTAASYSRCSFTN